MILLEYQVSHLALSAFNESENALHTAIRKARNSRKMITISVADINLARYFIGPNTVFHPI